MAINCGYLLPKTDFKGSLFKNRGFCQKQRSLSKIGILRPKGTVLIAHKTLVYVLVPICKKLSSSFLPPPSPLDTPPLFNRFWTNISSCQEVYFHEFLTNICIFVINRIIVSSTMSRGEGGKNLELSFLHIGTSTYTRVLCAIKTVPFGRKIPIFVRLLYF